jgi:hypothetical protein
LAGESALLAIKWQALRLAIYYYHKCRKDCTIIDVNATASQQEKPSKIGFGPLLISCFIFVLRPIEAIAITIRNLPK